MLIERLCSWYLLMVIDLSVHERQINTQYGYIIFGFFIQIFKVAADILFLMGAHHVVWSQISSNMAGALRWRKFADFVILLLIIMALYWLGSQFAFEVFWLQVADPDQIQFLLDRWHDFETAFAVLYWFLASAIMFISAVYLDNVLDQIRAFAIVVISAFRSNNTPRQPLGGVSRVCRSVPSITGYT